MLNFRDSGPNAPTSLSVVRDFRRETHARGGLVRLLVAIALGCSALALPVARAASGATTTKSTFAVTSTIDGKTVLPLRILWIADPNLPQSEVEQVQFLIDDKIRWVERKRPYVFGDDHDGEHKGSLVTSWLSAGSHRFTVRAVAIDGRTATKTTNARVAGPQKVPAALAGTWSRTISDTSSAPKPATADNPTETLTPPGVYMITFDGRWIQDEFPCTSTPCVVNNNTGEGWMMNADWTPGAKTFRVAGSVTVQEFHENDRLAGAWCWPDGPSATYSWTVTGDILTLAPVGGRDTCGIRSYVWAGQWKRVR